MEKGNNKGFSLIELIIVIAIMAVLLVILVPSYLRYVERTRGIAFDFHQEPAGDTFKNMMLGKRD